MDLKKLAAALGLPENATEEQCMSTLVAKMAAAAEAESLKGRLALATDELKTTKTELNRLQEADRTRTEAETKAKVEASVLAAIQEGRINSASREKALAQAAKDPEGFAAFLATLPKGGAVPLGEQGGANPSAIIPADGGLTSQQKAINAQLGLSDEVFLKYNPRQ